MGGRHSLAVTSGTAAIRVALAAAGATVGHEVITQAFTFVATAEAIIESGAQPVCVDIDATLNMDPVALKKAITDRTRAVIVVHMLGTPANMKEIVNICKSQDLILIEDTAWGCGGMLNGQRLGAIGDIGTFSFDYAKAITTGEGGMVAFRDQTLFKKAQAWHDHGHENNPMLPRWKDSRSSSGFNYRMMELQGAIGIAQLKKLDSIISSQRQLHAQLEKVVNQFPLLALREAPEGSYISADAFVFMTPSSSHALQIREGLIEGYIYKNTTRSNFVAFCRYVGTHSHAWNAWQGLRVYTNYHRRFLNVP